MKGWTSAAVGWALAWGALSAAAWPWPSGEIASMVGFTLAFAAVVAAVLFGAQGAAGVQARGARRAGLLGGAAALTAGGALLGGPSWVSASVAGLGLLSLGAWGGAAIGRAVDHPRYLWPLVLVATGADLWSVTAPQGVSNQLIVEGQAPALVSLLMLAVPVPGVGVEPVLGVGDVAFSALILGLVWRHGLSARAALWGLVAGFGICWALLIALALPLPALPLIGPSAALALGAAVRPRAGELLLALAVVGVLFGGRVIAG